jgi:glycosyltransferase involved in cell wall biosynthesis
VIAETQQPLRILFVTSDKFPPFRPAAKAIFSDGLTRAGHRVDWLIQAADPGGSIGLKRYRGGFVQIAPTNDGSSRFSRLRKYSADIRNDLRIARLVKSRRYSLIQVKDKYIGALIALAVGRYFRVPVFYWLAYPHGEASLYAAKSGVARYAWLYRLRGMLQKWLLYRVIIPASAHAFVQSEQMRRDLAREGVPPQKMTAVPSSLNLEEIDRARRIFEPTQEGDRHSIVYLGTLLRERRLDFLVRVLAKVRSRILDASLVFVGRGEMPEDEAFLRREAERCGVERAMTISGWLPMHAAWARVRRAAVCVSPYFPIPILLSTSPTKLIEYMALGKAVVANEHPEQAAVLDRSGGGLVVPWDESRFADAIVTLLEDPSLAQSMGRAGRRYVEVNRTHSIMVGLVLGRYRDVAARLAADAAGSANGMRRAGSGRPRWLQKLLSKGF